MGLKNWLTTLGLGAGLMYFMDPEMGPRRRALMRGQLTKMQNDTTDLWEKGQRDLQNRAQGLREQKPSLRRGIGGLGGLQGSWSPGVRLVATGGGGLLTLYGLLRGGLKGMLASFFGFNLLAKGLTDKDFRGLIGENAGSDKIDFERSIMVNAPVDEVFSFWRNYENFPQFMSHVQEVRDLGSGRSHWVVKGPAGQPVAWDATITEMQPNRVIAWQSVPGSVVDNSGRVTFQDMNGSTRVNVHLAYMPPAGAVGHVVASLFGVDPASALDTDMQHFQSLLEQGKTSKEGQTVSRGQVAGSSTRSAEGGAAPKGSTSGKSGTQSRQQSGMPGGGQGRTDEIEPTGVYPASDLEEAPSDAQTQGMASWGQGDRDAAGYEDSGMSELDLGSETGGFDSIVPGNPAEEDETKPRKKKG